MGIDAAFDLVADLPADGPGIVLRIAELRGAGRDEDLRHLAAVEVFPRRRRAGRAKLLEDAGDALFLDQLAGLLDRLRRAVAVIQRQQLDLAAVDAALAR